MGMEFTAVPSEFEEYLDESKTPEKLAEELGLGKALAVAEEYPDAIVIGSDQMVAIGDSQLAKPKDMDDARAMIRLATQAPSKIVTSLAIVCKAEGIQTVTSETMYVYFKSFDEAVVNAYLQTGDYADKAGGYGIQSGAAPLIDHIEGNLDAVIGLPTHTLAPILQKLGVEAHPAEITPPAGLVVKQLQTL